MFKPLAAAILMLAGMFPSACSAEEFDLRWEHILCKAVDEQWVLQLFDAGDVSEFDKAKGTVADSIDLHVKTGQRFYSKVRVGKKTIELRGDLKPQNQPGDFVLNINASIAISSASFKMQPDLKLIELPDLTSCNTTIVLTVDKHHLLSGTATLPAKSDEELKLHKPDLEWMCVTLKAAEDGDQTAKPE